MLPDDVKTILEAAIGGAIASATTVGGGCMSNATRIEAGGAAYFVKWSRGDARRTFEAEAAGLKALREADTRLIVPSPLLARDARAEGPGVILMEWIEPGPKKADFWAQMGRGLAELHRHMTDRYGFHGDNFIGRLPQRNDWRQSWPDFFGELRLEPQVSKAREGGAWVAGWDELYDRLLHRLGDILPRAPEASILHGDLWGGNFIVHADGSPAVVDPAAYFGHREADLAMTELFGGFDREFYDSYRSTWQIEPGYEERRDVYNLYHLINHLNHFGGSYAGSVERTLRRYGGRA